MFLKKSSQEILKDAAISIAQNSDITNFNAGSIARSIVEAIAPEIGQGTDASRASLYTFAQDVMDQTTLAQAKDKNLDMIGGLFSYPRRTESVRDSNGVLFDSPISDEAYRYEISQVVPAMATANYTAIRLALLTVQGVKDIIPKEYSHGTGSFSLILIPQYGFEEKDVVIKMLEVIEKTKSFGVKPNIILTMKVPVDLTVKLIFHETTSDPQKQSIRFETQSIITNYLGTKERGSGLIYNDLTQEIMNANEKIIDFEIIKFYMNNEPVLLTNQGILEDEQLSPQNILFI